MELKYDRFIGVKELLERTQKDIQSINPDNVPQYHLPCLNDFLFGFQKSSLTVIGADTGIGKSQFALDLARHNALNGKKVYLFSLEGDKNEPGMRWIYEKMAQEYYESPNGRKINYNNYVNNDMKDFSLEEATAIDELSEMEGNLFIFDRTVEFDIDTLTQQMEMISDKADLVIIDHLHYFSMFDNEAEHSQISKIMRRIKDLTEYHNVPVVLISHLRKKNEKRGIGDNEDFMGSSNIPKVATTAILLYNSIDNNMDNKYATIIRVSKSREGMKSNIGFLVYFDLDTRRYEKEYQLVKIDKFNKIYEMKEAEYPSWCLELMGKSRWQIKKEKEDNYNVIDKINQGEWDD